MGMCCFPLFKVGLDFTTGHITHHIFQAKKATGGKSCKARSLSSVLDFRSLLVGHVSGKDT